MNTCTPSRCNLNKSDINYRVNTVEKPNLNYLNYQIKSNLSIAQLILSNSSISSNINYQPTHINNYLNNSLTGNLKLNTCDLMSFAFIILLRFINKNSNQRNNSHKFKLSIQALKFIVLIFLVVLPTFNLSNRAIANPANQSITHLHKPIKVSLAKLVISRKNYPTQVIEQTLDHQHFIYSFTLYNKLNPQAP